MKKLATALLVCLGANSMVLPAAKKYWKSLEPDKVTGRTSENMTISQDDRTTLTEYINWLGGTTEVTPDKQVAFVDLYDRLADPRSGIFKNDDARERVVNYLQTLAAEREKSVAQPTRAPGILRQPKPTRASSSDDGLAAWYGGDDEAAQRSEPDEDDVVNELREHIERCKLADEKEAPVEGDSWVDRYYKQRIKDLEELHGVVWDEIDTSKQAFREEGIARCGRDTWLGIDSEPQPWPEDDFCGFVPKNQPQKTALERAEEAVKKAQRDVEDARKSLKEAEEEDVDAAAQVILAQWQKEGADKKTQKELEETKKALERTKKENEQLQKEWRVAQDALEKADPAFFKKVDKKEAKGHFLAALKAGGAQCASGAWRYTKIAGAVATVASAALVMLEIGYGLTYGHHSSFEKALKYVAARSVEICSVGGAFGIIGAASQAAKDACMALYQYFCPEPTTWKKEENEEGGHYIKMAVGTPLLTYLAKELINVWSKTQGRRGITIHSTMKEGIVACSFLAFVGAVGEAVDVYLKYRERPARG
ncbi:hypothetical protein K2W90_06040 [Candidatus Babeliales bacterium]|nr:hypothetical protein [Candidatus Babeliales bacterium]